MAPVRVLVVAPLPAVRAGLRAMLGLAGELEVAGEAERLAGLEPGPNAPGADVVLVDGGEVLADDLAGGPLGPGIVILGPVPDAERLPDALHARAWGYLPRSSGAKALIDAVRAVADGLVVIDPALGGHLFAPAKAAASTHTEQDEELTAREREVLQLVALGLSNKSIAARLGISEHTVKFHVAAILGKLGAGSRTEAVHLGARRGLVVL